MNTMSKSKGAHEYWVSFEYHNGKSGTWTDHADTPDEFIDDLLERRGDDIAKFLELQQHVDEWPSKPNKKISVKKYNRSIQGK